MTGGRGLSLLASSSVQSSGFSGAISASASSTGGAISSSALVSIPSSVATRVAVSKSMVVLIDAIVPMFTSARMRSTMLTSRSVASSRTETCFGSTTGGRPSMTATAGAACSTGATTACGRCGLRPRGRGPRCGGNRRGRAFGITRSPSVVRGLPRLVLPSIAPPWWRRSGSRAPSPGLPRADPVRGRLDPGQGTRPVRGPCREGPPSPPPPETARCARAPASRGRCGTPRKSAAEEADGRRPRSPSG